MINQLKKIENCQKIENCLNLKNCLSLKNWLIKEKNCHNMGIYLISMLKKMH